MITKTSQDITIKKIFKKSSSIQTLTVATGIAPVPALRLAEYTADWELHPTLKFFVPFYPTLLFMKCQIQKPGHIFAFATAKISESALLHSQ